jgi:HTH-type transcriptional repressor of NAD biosynthesis genes
MKGSGILKVCFYGPESTGKSTMARRMAEHYQTVFVPEVAREMITSNKFTEADIIRIGKAQTQRIVDREAVAHRVLFCDTDLITTQIYAEIYLKKVPVVLIDLEKTIEYDCYFLFDIDVPWVSDGLRDLGARRGEMMTLFRSKLESRKIAYKLVSGSWEQRERVIISAVDDLLMKAD